MCASPATNPAPSPIVLKQTCPLPCTMVAREGTPSAPGRIPAHWAGGSGAKDAERFASALSFRSQAPVPAQAPLQPVNCDPAAGVAEREMVAPSSKAAAQAVPQSIPAGEERTAPAPVTETVKVCLTTGTGARTKVANTATGAGAVEAGSLQSPGPEQAPPQPSKRHPGCGEGTRLTATCARKLAAQVEPQSMPAGSERTPPWPFTCTEMMRRGAAGTVEKEAPI